MAQPADVKVVVDCVKGAGGYCKYMLADAVGLGLTEAVTECELVVVDVDVRLVAIEGERDTVPVNDKDDVVVLVAVAVLLAEAVVDGAVVE